jgi:glycosyltransferase involved in cell wall biosynthesis
VKARLQSSAQEVSTVENSPTGNLPHVEDTSPPSDTTFCTRLSGADLHLDLAGPVVVLHPQAQVAVDVRLGRGRYGRPRRRFAFRSPCPSGGLLVARPVLSVTMPTRNRPELLERALRSLVTAMAPVAEHVEITVSDGSDADASGRVVERVLGAWPGGHRYVWNRPALTLVENMNRAAELATGEWVQQLDDDDLMLPECGQPMIDVLRRATPDEQVLVFGAHIVDASGAKQREQTFEREQYLSPREALRRLLRNSSFVREPMVVVRRTALVEAGLFELEVGDVTDLDMWVKLFSRHGARCLPVTTCAYTIHEAAATTGMWNPRTIEVLSTVFDRAAASGVVPEREVRRWQADYIHQFILAGVYRRLRARRRAEARDVLQLFRLPAVKALGPSPKWLPVRLAFTTATAIPLWAA